MSACPVLRRIFWVAVILLAAGLLAGAPTVSIGLDGPAVVLSWKSNPVNAGGYRVWYSEKPYFQPREDGATPVDLPRGSTGWTHTGAAMDPSHHYDCLVQGKGAGGAESAPSNRTSAFSFALMRW
jgi:hypothetical protein